jgi:hypothetical protein
MSNQIQTTEALRRLFGELAEPKESRIRIVGELCGIASKVDELECRADAESRLHIFVNGSEVFEWTLRHGKSDFRNLLATMYGFGKEFGDSSSGEELSPYKLDCIIKPAADGEGHAVRLETVNTLSGQRFRFSKV